MTTVLLCAGCFLTGLVLGLLIGRHLGRRGGRHRGIQLRRP